MDLGMVAFGDEQGSPPMATDPERVTTLMKYAAVTSTAYAHVRVTIKVYTWYNNSLHKTGNDAPYLW